MSPLLLALTAIALGMDGRGPPPARPTAALVEPLWSWSTDLPAAGEAAAGLDLEYVGEPLVRTVLDGASVEREVVLATLVGADLGGVVGLHERLALGVGLPLWSATGSGSSAFAVGDLRVDAPVSLVPGHLVAVPWVSLPTGDADRYVGEGGLAGGMDLSGGLGVGSLRLGAQAGIAVRPEAELGLPAGPELRGAVWAGALATDWLALTGEMRASASSGSASPLEAGVGARVRLGSSLVGGAAASRGLTDAPASPSLRLSASLTWVHRAKDQVEVAPPPAAPAPVLRVLDLDGAPVRGARIGFTWEALGYTDHLGELQLPAGLDWGAGVEVSADGCQPALLDGVPEGGVVVLPWAPIELSLRVLGQEGEVLDADVRLVGATDPEALRDEVGTLTYALEPGLWELEVSAPGYVTQGRTLQVDPGRDTIHVDAILSLEVDPKSRLAVQVRDPQGSPVEDAFLSLDGVPLGNTGPGGDVVVRGLAPTTASLAVATGDLEDALLSEVTVAADSEVVEVVLGWVPGSVRVRARGPDGTATDAMVRFSGPVELSPARLGRDGQRVFVLRPGPWQALLSSPSLGAQERGFLVPEDAEPIVLDFVLQPVEQGEAELVLRVMDPDGEPLPGVEVSVDGLPLGLTSTAGTVRTSGLGIGPREVTLEGPDLRPWTGELRLVEGLQEVDAALAWEPGMLQVTATGPGGSPVDALARLSGSGEVPAMRLGRDGAHRLRLEPGPWDLLVSHPELGMQARSLHLPEGGRTLHRADVRLVPPETGESELIVRVADPADSPVAGIEVTLDGASMGRTSGSGSIRLGGLRRGERSVATVAPGYRTARATVFLGPEPADIVLTVDPEGAVLDIEVAGPGGTPVEDAVLRFSGPHPVGVLAMDTGGRRRVALGPGVWDVLVSSARWGIVQRRVEVVAGGGEQGLRVDLVREEEGVAVLFLRVRDEDGSPVEGAAVLVDGEPSGHTSASGSWLGSNLPPGPTRITVQGRGQTLPLDLALTLAEGSQQRIAVVRWPRTRVRLRVRDPEGLEADASVSFVGPAAEPAARTGPDGEHLVELRPGAWTVHAVMEGLVGTAEVDIEPGAPDRVLTVHLEEARARLSAEAIEHDRAIHFDTDEAELLPEAAPVLHGVAEVILSSPGLVSVEVQGHTDDVGGVMYNIELSERRAHAVREALVALGVPPEVLVARGYGLLRPVADNSTEDGRARNRRVEFRVLEQHRVISPPDPRSPPRDPTAAPPR